MLLEILIFTVVIVACVVDVIVFRAVTDRVRKVEQVQVALDVLVRKANERATLASVTAQGAVGMLTDEIRARQAGDQEAATLVARQGRLLSEHVESNLHRG